MILTEEKIDLLEETIKQGQSAQDDLKQKHSDLGKNIGELNQKIKNNLMENENLRAQIEQLQEERNSIANEYNPWNQKIDDAEKAIAAHARESKLQKLATTFPTFCKVLEARIRAKQESIAELMPNFINFTEPKDAANAIDKAIAGMGMSVELVNMRAAKNNYEEAIRTLCEKRLDNKQITLAEGQAHIAAIDVFITLPHVEKYWHTHEQQTG